MNYKFEHTGKTVALTIIPVMVIAVIAFIAIRQDMFEKRFYYKTSMGNASGISARSSLEHLRSTLHQPLPEGGYAVSIDFTEGLALLRQYSPNSSDPIRTIVADYVWAKNSFTHFENSDVIAKTDVALARLEGEKT